MSLIARRDVLRFGAAGLCASALPSELFAAPKVPKIPIGLQLYSIRDDCKKDFDGALKWVAEQGFEGVEFAGYYGYQNDAAGLRKKLDELKLKAAGTHIGAGALRGDALKKTVEFHKAIGCNFLIVPGDGDFTHPVKSKDFAEFMTKTAETLKAEGLSCGYHNHDREFTMKDGDKTYWDLFAERTSKDVILQQDVGHTVFAGADPVAYVRKHPGRTKTTHIKGRLPKGAPPEAKPFVGQDTIKWKDLVTAYYEVGGTEWFIIEQENYPDGKTPMECTKISLDNFRKILGEMGK